MALLLSIYGERIEGLSMIRPAEQMGTVAFQKRSCNMHDATLLCFRLLLR